MTTDAKFTPCTGRVFIPDDRMGGFVNRCERAEGHDGPHLSRRDGHDPPAWLSWHGTYGDPRKEQR